MNAANATPTATDIDIPKPNLVIHIGPSKTGTTSIQKESVLFEAQLQQDNYVYLGRYANPKLREPAKVSFLFRDDDCFRQASTEYAQNITREFRETPCWKERFSTLDEYRANGTSIVLSDEAYSYGIKYVERDVQYYTSLKMALSKDWNLLIVPTYRRYYEWILSVAKEYNQKHCLATTAPWDNHTQCENLWEKVNNHRRNNIDYHGIHYGNLDQTIPAWQEGGWNVRILNFHNPNQHITCDFYCHYVPNAKHTCQHCIAGNHQHTNAQSASMTAYNDIVYTAAQRGILTTEEMSNRTRYEMTQDLKRHHHSAGLDRMPVKCPHRVLLEKLLEKSLAFERLIMPDFSTTPEGEAMHKRDFWAMEKQYCTVDVDALLAGKSHWNEVVEAMQTTKEWDARVMEMDARDLNTIKKLQ